MDSGNLFDVLRLTGGKFSENYASEAGFTEIVEQLLMGGAEN